MVGENKNNAWGEMGVGGERKRIPASARTYLCLTGIPTFRHNWESKEPNKEKMEAKGERHSGDS